MKGYRATGCITSHAFHSSDYYAFLYSINALKKLRVLVDHVARNFTSVLVLI